MRYKSRTLYDRLPVPPNLGTQLDDDMLGTNKGKNTMDTTCLREH